MKANLLEKLKTIAPNVVFSATRQLDPYCSWDGDGPSPRDEGFSPYNVIVVAKCIERGEIIEGESCLGSSWFKHDEPIGDAHGYLPQMLEEAATELQEKAGEDRTNDQLLAAIVAIKSEMKRAYNEQMAGK